MARIIKLSESQLHNVIKRIIKEQDYTQADYQQPQFQNKSGWDDSKQYGTTKPPNKDWSLPSPTKQDAVMQLQDSLNLAGFNVMNDGIFGDKTKQAVAQYQKNNGLKVTGVVDASTAQAMGLSQTIGRFLPLFSKNTFNQRPAPTAPVNNTSINPNQQNRGWNEDPTSHVDNTPMKMGNYVPLHEANKKTTKKETKVVPKKPQPKKK